MKSYSVTKIILMVWIVFSVVYIALAEWQRFKVFIYDRGVTEAVARVIEQAQRCQPFPVYADGVTVNLVNVDCLQPEKKSETSQKDQ